MAELHLPKLIIKGGRYRHLLSQINSIENFKLDPHRLVRVEIFKTTYKTYFVLVFEFEFGLNIMN